MKNFIKKWWLCCAILAGLVSICIAIVGKDFDAPTENDECEKVFEENLEEDIKDLLLVKHSETEADNLCIVVEDGKVDLLDKVYNNQYIVTEKRNGHWIRYKVGGWMNDYTYYYYEPMYETYDLDLYDIDTLELVNHMDGKKLMADILNQNEMYVILPYVRCEQDMTFMVELETLYNYKENKILKYDLKTGEQVQEVVNTDKGRSEEYQKRLSLLTTDHVKEYAYENSLPAQNGFSQFECYEKPEMPGTVLVRIASSDLPSNNKSLYLAFPELQQFKGKSGYYIGVYLQGYMEPESILRLFMNDEESIIQYQGMIVNENAAYDGKEHTVNNANEYYHWLDYNR